MTNAISMKWPDIARLASAGQAPHVTLWLPCHRTGTDRQQSAIELKQLVAEAEADLISQGMRPTLAQEMLGKALALRGDENLWLRQPAGLGIFLSADFMKVIEVDHPVEQAAYVMPRFYIRPLAEGGLDNSRYYVLAIEKNRSRLFKGSAAGLREVEVPNMPKNMEAVVGVEHSEKQLQYHSAGPVGRAGARIAHGAGDPGAHEKGKLLRYFQAINRAVASLLHESHAPMVLAMDLSMAPIYKNANTYRYLSGEVIAGSPKMSDAGMLHDRAWPLVQPVFLKLRNKAFDRYTEFAGTGLTCDQINLIVPMALSGRVETLFLKKGSHAWGALDIRRQVTVHEDRQPGDDELLNLACVATLDNGGYVHELEPDLMPTREKAAAVYRF